MAERSTIRITTFWRSFTDLLSLPRALWIIIGAFVVDSMAYFGMLTVMTLYLTSDLGWTDANAGRIVSIFTMLVTLFMLGAGSYAEKLGLRRAIVIALLLTLAGRGLYSAAALTSTSWALATSVLVALVVIALGEAILQPVCYSGVKQYTDEKTSSMGYGLIYAVMNLGIVGIGTLSSWMRPAVQRLKDSKPADAVGEPVLHFFASFSGSGVQAVNWACTALTALTLIAFLIFMTRRAEAEKLRPDMSETSSAETAASGSVFARLKQFFAGGPFSNPRFIFFIFMLLPVRTLFAHQWLTMPTYIVRAYPQGIADRMEWLVNWINPAIIFIGVPIATALTRQVPVYKMMIIGSLVSAAPTFLLAGGPNLTLLITYFVVFSIGEALWSARFLEYASELAPPGRVAQYMGLANIPWLLAKGTTGFYSGLMLRNYCPDQTPPAELETGTMWIIYGCIAMLSPIGLWLARNWVMAGLRSKHVRPEGVSS